MRKLHIVIVERKNGRLEAAYIGEDCGEAQSVLAKESESERNLCAAQFFKPQPVKIRTVTTKQEEKGKSK